MNYISKEKKILTGRNNNKVCPFIVDFDTITPIDFQIVDKNNQLQEIVNGTYYFAGGLKTKNIDTILFLSESYLITDNVLTFNLDTYTSTFLEHITKRNMQIDIEIGVFTEDGNKYIILRDYALAMPRIYDSSMPPPDIDLDEYYTTEQINFILNSYVTQTQLNSKGYLTGIPVEYITQSQLNSKDFITQTQLTNKGYLTGIPAEYITQTQLTNKGYLTGIPAEYITQTQLTNKGYLTGIPAEYITQTQLTNKGYLTGIPAEYITQSQLNNKGYLTEIPSEYVTETQLTNKDFITQTQLNNKGYLTQVPSEYVTQTQLNSKDFITQTQLINKGYLTEELLRNIFRW